MALQLAFYRKHGTFTATYESAQTTGFRHGRTETIRTLSIQSKAWVLSMSATPFDSQHSRELLVQAVTAHSEYSKQAGYGRGIDRHILGLRVLASEAGITSPVFTDPAYAKSNVFRLSTSGVPDT